MEKNKSIDGLKPRHSKKTTSPIKTTKNTPVKKTKKVAAAKVKTTPVKVVQKEEPKVDPVEDFLKPVQAFNFDESTGKLQAAEKPIEKESKKVKPEKPHKKRKGIIIAIIIILLVLAGVATGFILWGNDIIAKITGGQGTVFDLITFTEPTYNPLKVGANGRTNILVFGTSSYNMNGDEGDYVHDGAQLTDSIMVISLNQDNGDIAMLSLPRDLKASPTCTATGKINEVYWCNNMYADNEQAGAEALMTEVGDILGIDFQYYAHRVAAWAASEWPELFTKLVFPTPSMAKKLLVSPVLVTAHLAEISLAVLANKKSLSALKTKSLKKVSQSPNSSASLLPLVTTFAQTFLSTK